MTLPLQHVRDWAEALLAWDRPAFTGAMFALLQIFVLYDLVRFVPALVAVALAGHIMEQQRSRGTGPYRDTYIYTYISIYIHIYIYLSIYIYMYML